MSLASLIAAKPEIRAYPGWQLGSGLEHVPSFRKAYWQRLKNPKRIAWLSDLFIHIYPGNEASGYIFLTGLYEPNEFLFLNGILKNGMNFMDVGANMGLYSLFAARKVGTTGVVIALEPSSRDYERLVKNVNQNQLSNVRAFRLAAFKENTFAVLKVASELHSGHNTLGRFSYESTRLDQEEKVETRTIDELITEQRLERLDAMKIDVEGAEVAVLEGAAKTISKFKPVVLIEVFDQALRNQNASSASIADFFRSMDYVIYRFDPETGIPIPSEIGSGDASENIIAMHGEDDRVKRQK